MGGRRKRTARRKRKRKRIKDGTHAVADAGGNLGEGRRRQQPGSVAAADDEGRGARERGYGSVLFSNHG